MAEQVRKITVKGILGNKSPEANPKTPVTLAHVLGIAHNYMRKESTYGPYNLFKGNFEAINAATGENMKSNALIIPEPGQSALEAALDGAGDSVKGIEFAFTIGVIPDTDKTRPSARGYQFVCSSHIADTADPLESIRNRGLKAITEKYGKIGGETEAEAEAEAEAETETETETKSKSKAKK